MSIVEFLDDNLGDSRNQRWGHFLTLGFMALAFIIGLNLRDSTLYATDVYINNEVGIRAEYPRGWLIDFDSDYVFRVRDINRVGFKTTIQIGLYPFTNDMTERNVLDSLSLSRPLTLSTYLEIDTRDVVLPRGEMAVSHDYTFVYTEPDPFLAPLPVVVIGRDILIVRRGQVILITFIADALTFEDDLATFDRFLSNLEL